MKQENIMSIVPFYDGKGKSCYDNIIISVAVWAGIDYRPMYVDQWKFAFEKKENPTGIWKRGEMASYLYYDDQLLTGRNLNRLTNLTVYSRVLKGRKISFCYKESFTPKQTGCGNCGYLLCPVAGKTLPKNTFRACFSYSGMWWKRNLL